MVCAVVTANGRSSIVFIEFGVKVVATYYREKNILKVHLEPCVRKNFGTCLLCPFFVRPWTKSSVKKYHSMDALKEAIAWEWIKIPEGHIHAACNVFPARLMAIIKANGAHIERKWLKSKFQSFSNMFDLGFNRKILKVYCRTFSKRCVLLKLQIFWSENCTNWTKWTSHWFYIRILIFW